MKQQRIVFRVNRMTRQGERVSYYEATVPAAHKVQCVSSGQTRKTTVRLFLGDRKMYFARTSSDEVNMQKKALLDAFETGNAARAAIVFAARQNPERGVMKKGEILQLKVMTINGKQQYVLTYNYNNSVELIKLKDDSLKWKYDPNAAGHIVAKETSNTSLGVAKVKKVKPFVHRVLAKPDPIIEEPKTIEQTLEERKQAALKEIKSRKKKKKKKKKKEKSNV